MPFEPTVEQLAVIDRIGCFLAYKGEAPAVFVMRGYAGTGKTSVIAAIANAFQEGLPVCLAAPTGRAAKVISGYARREASTIHHLIYRQVSAEYGAHMKLGYNKLRNALFVVDEASLLTDEGEPVFGSGSLLDDLLEYVYENGSCKLLVSGDTAQLPPVMRDFSPALQSDFYKCRGFEVFEADLSKVLRQNENSGVLTEATRLRGMIASGGMLRLQTHPDVKRISGAEFVESLEQSYREVGEESAIVITRSNKMAQYYANGIRSRVLWREELVSNSDMLMVIKNNYYVGQKNGLDFIANGDIVEVVRTGKHFEMYGFKFMDVTLRMVDYDREIDARLLVDSLQVDTPSNMQAMNDKLFRAVEEDYADIRNKRVRYQQLRQDPWLNALQVKPAYAVTCHKAQGGQWAHVYVDMGRIDRDALDKDTLRWLYTAFTRSSQKLFLINSNDSLFAQSSSASR
ncbi:MAG: AAA family ATPase [Paludibacteraceae bacterium]|nr:AAA family ATPase [Paludibacteraceae bacterium]